MGVLNPDLWSLKDHDYIPYTRLQKELAQVCKYVLRTVDAPALGTGDYTDTPQVPGVSSGEPRST